MNFHETICGRRFFDAQLPHLIKALERIADGLTQPKMSLPHGMTIEPNFLHDLYYGEYEPSVLRSRTKSSRYLTTQYLRLRPPYAGNSPKLLQLWQLSRCTKRPPVSATAL